MKKYWQQLTLTTSPQILESLEDALLAQGAVSVTIEDAADQPLLEPGVGEMPLWDHLIVKALFESGTDIQHVEYQLCQQFDMIKPDQLQHNMIVEQDWERAWLDDFKPMQFGQRLWVCPSSYQPPQAEAVNIILDPGLAFGTGTHPTTAMCLNALDAMSLNGKTVIDYGCGSGILAIAALKLGAKEVWAIDNDPQALLATKDNAERNEIDLSQLHISLPEAFSAVAVDVLVANILAKPLIDFQPLLTQLIRPKGTLILSGILVAQADEVLAAYSQFALEQQQQNDWVCLHGAQVAAMP